MSLEAFGQDFLEKVPDGTLFLSSPDSKGWIARQGRTLTRVEHPGTAVRLEGDVFEVLEAHPLADGRVRYKLGPWDFRYTIRVLQSYDASTEEKRIREHSRRHQSIWKRRLAILFSPLLGHLPGPVQERMEGEFGAPAYAMTIVSALPLLVLGFLGVLARLLTRPVLPWDVPLPLALYFFLESIYRLGTAFLAGHPVGSLLGVLSYGLWSKWSGGPPVPRLSTAGTQASKPQAMEDRYRMLEPVLALLSPAEQQLLLHRFGFEFLRWGRITAVCLLAFSGVAVLTALKALIERVGNLGDIAVLIVGAGFLVEQISRLTELGRGFPAGSVLARLVRPLARQLLSQGGHSV